MTRAGAHDKGEALLRRGELHAEAGLPAAAGWQRAAAAAVGARLVRLRHGRRPRPGRARDARCGSAGCMRPARPASTSSSPPTGTGQVLLQPIALFYDRKAPPYFVSIAARAAPDFRALSRTAPSLLVENAARGSRRPTAPLARRRLLRSRRGKRRGTALLTTIEVERELAAAPAG